MSLKSSLKRLGSKVGKLVKKAAPLAAFALPFAPVAAGVLGALGKAPVAAGILGKIGGAVAGATPPFVPGPTTPAAATPPILSTAGTQPLLERLLALPKPTMTAQMLTVPTQTQAMPAVRPLQVEQQAAQPPQQQVSPMSILSTVGRVAGGVALGYAVNQLPSLPGVGTLQRAAQTGFRTGGTMAQLGPQGACGVPGYHFAKDGSGRMVRNRRMNPLNPQAARRAIRRIKGAMKMLKAIERELPKRTVHSRSR